MPKTMIDLTVPVEKAFLVGVDTGADAGWPVEDSLSELASLATTAGAEVVGAEWQNRRHIDPNWYIGKGKAEELVAAKSETGFDVLIADDELSPGQQRALEELLKVKVIDRSRDSSSTSSPCTPRPTRAGSRSSSPSSSTSCRG